MLRPNRRPNHLLLLLLAIAACSGQNPLYNVGSLDGGDGPGAEVGQPDRDGPDTPVTDTGPADLPPVDMVDGAAAEAPPTPGALGAACTAPGGCQSGYCVDGVCCDTACRERCRSCGLAGSAGTCTLIPAGLDPRQECPAQDPATCGRAGGCNGSGDCQLHVTGTECRARSCSSGVEIAAARCDGSGTCLPGTPMACSLNECAGDRCTVGCSTTSCPTGFQCQAGKCVGGGPALHWRFDEASGPAVDSSPNGFTGTYRGDGTLPAPSTNVPARSTFTNPRSLGFGASGRPGVQLSAVNAALRPTSTLTVSLWYRATTALTSGSDLINFGDDYLMRVRPTIIEFAKRKSDVEGMIYQLATARDLVGHLDGNWHHLAGVITATTVNLYVDGTLRVSKPNSDPILYRGTELWVGRDGPGAHPFQGNIDDLRIYPRDLSRTEIEQLAAGGP